MKHQICVALALLSAGLLAHAQEGAQPPQVEAAPAVQPVAPPAAMTASEMVESAGGSFLTPREQAFAAQEEELLRQIRIAQMQLELIEIQKKMRDGASRPPDSVNVAQPDAPVIDAPQRDPFHLVSIWGDDAGLQADLLVAGRRVTVRSGGTIADGWRVARVSERAVDIAKGSERRTLSLGSFQ